MVNSENRKEDTRVSTITDTAKKKLSTSKAADAKPNARMKTEGTRVSTVVDVRGAGNKKIEPSQPNRFRDGT
jgi:hypothetical protein